jgi:ABC-2 type transport system ATP-binding protein
LIKVNHLTKNYSDKTAVKQLSFNVQEGELFAFLGPNGSGKSTTIKMLLGLVEPAQGEIEILGMPPDVNNIELKQQWSFVPDTPDIIGKLTGQQYLNFVASVYKMSKPLFEERLNELLEWFDLKNDLNMLVEEYSHGMRQKLVLIGALMHEPKVIFLDEPNVGLDPKSTKHLKQYLREYVGRGNTVFLTTHTLSLAEEIADRILIIYEGEEKATGTLNELRIASGLEEGTLEDVFLRLTEEAAPNVSNFDSGESVED